MRFCSLMLPLQLAGAELGGAQYEQQPEEEEEEDGRVYGEAAHALSLSGVQHLDSLRTLLDALLTPRMPLCDLHIGFSNPPPAAVRGCEQQLSGLTALSIYSTSLAGPGGGTNVAVLQTLLEQAPRAVKLEVTLANECSALPSCVASRPWRVLCLHGVGLTDLPAGPYLTGFFRVFRV